MQVGPRALLVPGLPFSPWGSWVLRRAGSRSRALRWGILGKAHLLALSPPSSGSVPWKVHRYGLHPPFLQADAEQETNPERPGVHRPRILQLHRLDQVRAPPSPHAGLKAGVGWGGWVASSLPAGQLRQGSSGGVLCLPRWVLGHLRIPMSRGPCKCVTAELGEGPFCDRLLPPGSVVPPERTTWRSAASSCTSSRTWRSWAR